MSPDWKENTAQEVTAELFNAHPWLDEKFGESGKEYTLKDNYHHLDYLETAYLTQSVHVFKKYTHWLIDVLSYKEIPVHLIEDNFCRLIAHLSKIESPNKREFMKECLEQGLVIVREKIK